MDCRYEDAYERPWIVAMGGPDDSWAEPGLGTNPLNYTLAFCDIIGKSAARASCAWREKDEMVATTVSLGSRHVKRKRGVSSSSFLLSTFLPPALCIKRDQTEFRSNHLK